MNAAAPHRTITKSNKTSRGLSRITCGQGAESGDRERQHHLSSLGLVAGSVRDSGSTILDRTREAARRKWRLGIACVAV